MQYVHGLKLRLECLCTDQPKPKKVYLEISSTGQVRATADDTGDETILTIIPVNVREVAIYHELTGYFLGMDAEGKLMASVLTLLSFIFYNKVDLAWVHTWDAVQGKCVQQLLCCLLVPWVSHANIESLARWQRSFHGCARGVVRIYEAVTSEKWPTQIQINSRQKNEEVEALLSLLATSTGGTTSLAWRRWWEC